MSTLGRYSVETPESIEVTFELAGPGSRFCAMIIDTSLAWLVLFVIVIVAIIAGAPIMAALDDDAPADERLDSSAAAWAVAILIAAAMLALFGYYTFFELILRGQTPGKRSMKIRVIHDDGTPAAPLDIVIRNLVRVVDARLLRRRRARLAVQCTEQAPG